MVKTQSIRKIIRVSKNNSAYIYAILESLEGMTMYSTLDGKVGDHFCDLELLIAPDFVKEVTELIEIWREKGLADEQTKL